jgi:hypothetical protein
MLKMAPDRRPGRRGTPLRHGSEWFACKHLVNREFVRKRLYP